MPTLYLIPTTISQYGIDHIPSVVKTTVQKLRTFVVERERTSRRYIRQLVKDFPIDDAVFLELDKHDLLRSSNELSRLLSDNRDIGLMSESGVPCIADPGSQVVSLAREAGYKIKPLTGPSSIMLALMASGMNGQQFSFHGYLPVKESPLKRKLNELSTLAKKGISQIFIETPYRNNQMLKHILKYVDNHLYLAIAIDITGTEELILCKKVSNWPRTELPKSPAIFIVGNLKEI